MQTPISNVKDILLNWDTITLQSPLISAVITGIIIALITWLLLLLYYRFKIGNLRKRLLKVISASEQERFQLSEALTSTAQQLEDVELDLSSHKRHIEQLTKDHERAQVQIKRALVLENHLDEDLTSLQTRFFLNESLPVQAEGDDSLVWLKHNAAVNELTGRLKPYAQFQLELQQKKSALTALLAEQAVTIETLNQKIALQATELSQREQDFAAQQSQMEQQQAQLKAELFKVNEQLEQSVGLEKHFSSVVNQQTSPALETSMHTDTLIGQGKAILEDVGLTDKPEETFSLQAEETAKSMFKPITSAVQWAEEKLDTADMPSVKAEVVEAAAKVEVTLTDLAEQVPAEALSAVLTPMNKLKKMFHFGQSVPPTAGEKSISVSENKLQSSAFVKAASKVDKGSATDSLNKVSQTAQAQSSEAATGSSKLKKVLGIFSKNTIVEYVETALEQNDAKVAEQASEENNIASEDLPKKSKGFWRKIIITH